MTKLLSEMPLMMEIDHSEVEDFLHVGYYYSKHLMGKEKFPTAPLKKFVQIVASNIDPRREPFRGIYFDYVDLREVDEVYGDFLRIRRLKGSRIGSTKTRYRSGDILLAKIMPSLANRKTALAPQGITNGLASTEFIVLRKKPESEINWYYLFRALRSDDFVKQAVANVTGATGRQRINPRRLLELRVTVPPAELQDKIGRIVEEEFSLRRDAHAKKLQADEACADIIGTSAV